MEHPDFFKGGSKDNPLLYKRSGEYCSIRFAHGIFLGMGDAITHPWKWGRLLWVLHMRAHEDTWKIHNWSLSCKEIFFIRDICVCAFCFCVYLALGLIFFNCRFGLQSTIDKLHEKVLNVDAGLCRFIMHKWSTHMRELCHPKYDLATEEKYIDICEWENP